MTNYDAEVSCIYLGVLDGYSEKEQTKDCKKYIKANELAPVERRVYAPKDLAELIRSLRGDELVIVARVESLKEYNGRGVGKRLLENVADIVGKCVCIIDVSADLDSKDVEWRAHLDKEYNRAGKTRKKKSTDHYKAMAARRKNIGITRKWQDKKGSKQYREQAAIWSNLNVREDIAKAQMHKDLKKLSTNSLRNIFGSRRACGKWLNEQR